MQWSVVITWYNRAPQQWPRQNIKQGLHSQKTPPTSFSRASYGVSFVSFFRKLPMLLWHRTVSGLSKIMTGQQRCSLTGLRAGPWCLEYLMCHTYVMYHTVCPKNLRGGTPPWGVIFHENVNFLFVAKKCKVTHTFHKIHKQYVIAAIETHILVNFFNKTVFGDYVFLPKIKMVSSIQLNILENSFTLQEYHIHRYIGHVLLNKMIENWTL